MYTYVRMYIPYVRTLYVIGTFNEHVGRNTVKHFQVVARVRVVVARNRNEKKDFGREALQTTS